jgi:hypothetical protein
MQFKDIRYAQLLIETILKDSGANTVSFETIDNRNVCVVNNFTVSMLAVDAANRNLEKMNIRLVQRVKEDNGSRKDFYEIIDLSVVQKIKDICITNGCSDNFRIDTNTVWGDRNVSVSLRYGYWRKLDVDTLNPLLKELGVKLELDSFDDDDCGTQYTNQIINL